MEDDAHKYDKFLLELVRDSVITTTEYVELKNCTLLNIKANMELLKTKQINILDILFYNVYKDFIKKKDDKLVFKNKIIFNRIIKKSNLTYTTGQLEAIEQLIKFMTNPEETYYGLYGYAGTGKTTTIIDFLINCIEMKYINSLIFTAPTNKALNVIKTKVSNRIKYLMHQNNIDYKNELSFDANCDKLQKINITINFQTIHKFLQYKSDYNQEGEIIFTRSDKNPISCYNVVVIDECSMIPLEMIYEIFKEPHKTKIIFTGDPAQLPPVNEKSSAIFAINNNLNISFLKKINKNITDDEYKTFYNKINNMNKYVLKEIVRTNNNSVIKSSNTIRDWIYNIGEFIKIAECTDINFNIYPFDKSAKTKTMWYKEFERLINEEKDTIIIAWTNEEVNYYNNFIRKSLFKKQTTREFELGELLILNETHMLENSTEKLNNKIKFSTSEKILVKSLQEVSEKICPLDNIKTDLKIFKNHHAVEIKYNKFIEKINSQISQIEFQCYKMSVIKIDEPDNMCDITVLRKDCMMFHKTIVVKVIEEIKKFRNELVQSYQLLSLDTHVIKPLYNEFHSKFVNRFASVSYGYAITCHKAQGSNYKNVFVDFTDIVKNNNDNEMRRCMYTAVTRTVDRLFVLI